MKDIYTKTMARLARLGVHDQKEQIVTLAEEIELYRAKIKRMEEELDKAHTINSLLERDIEDWRKLAESKVEESYPEFMSDYKCAMEELDALYEELEEVRKERDALRAKKIKPLAKKHRFRRWIGKFFGIRQPSKILANIDEMHNYKEDDTDAT